MGGNFLAAIKLHISKESLVALNEAAFVKGRGRSMARESLAEKRTFYTFRACLIQTLHRVLRPRSC